MACPDGPYPTLAQQRSYRANHQDKESDAARFSLTFGLG
jgi:hypothetical protein